MKGTRIEGLDLKKGKGKESRVNQMDDGWEWEEAIRISSTQARRFC